MAEMPVTIKVTVEMAHEQVLKLRCEYHFARALMFYALANGQPVWGYRYWRRGVGIRRELHRIARWL